MKTYAYLKKYTNSKLLDENDVCIIIDKQSDKYKVKFIRTNEECNIPSQYIEEFEISETGDRYDFKICDRCFKRLNTETHFQNNRIKKDNVITKRPSCKDCRKIKDGKSISNSDRKFWDEIKPKNYEPFTCPICNKTTIAGLSKIVLDHCHKTGKVRGYLCESCNTGIGRFDDDSKIINKAIDWLNN